MSRFFSQKLTCLININVSKVRLQRVPFIRSTFLWIKLLVASGTQCIFKVVNFIDLDLPTHVLVTFMSYTHWTWSRQGLRPGPWRMGFYFMLCTVLTTQEQGQYHCFLLYPSQSLSRAVCMSYPVADPRFLTQWAPTPEFVEKTYYLARFLAKNYIQMKEIGPGGGARVPSTPWLHQRYFYVSLSTKKSQFFSLKFSLWIMIWDLDDIWSEYNCRWLIERN